MILDKEFGKILAQMKELADCGDYEIAHSQADDLLLEALRHVGGFDELIEAWENVPKWYA